MVTVEAHYTRENGGIAVDATDNLTARERDGQYALRGGRENEHAALVPHALRSAWPLLSPCESVVGACGVDYGSSGLR